MNMSMDEILLYARNNNQIIAVNNDASNKKHRDILQERTKSFGTHEELRIFQDKMYEKYDIDYWLVDIIQPDYKKLIERIKNKRVFFDISNIFSYHVSYACYTLDELINSFNRLIDTLETHTKYYHLKGTNPLKKKVRITNG